MECHSLDDIILYWDLYFILDNALLFNDKIVSITSVEWPLTNNAWLPPSAGLSHMNAAMGSGATLTTMFCEN